MAIDKKTGAKPGRGKKPSDSGTQSLGPFLTEPQKPRVRKAAKPALKKKPK